MPTETKEKKMLSIAICDDDPRQLAIAKGEAGLYFSKRGEQAEILEFSEPSAIISEISRGAWYQILLLDIVMPGVSGIDLARQLRAAGTKAEIIFMTSSTEYAVDAFELNAVHYLLKPFSARRFAEALDRAVKNITSAPSEKVQLKLVGGAVRVVGADDIVFIEGASHQQIIHFIGGDTASLRESLQTLSEKLDKLSPGQFVIPYKGYIVNLKHVSCVAPGSVTMNGGESLPLARGAFRTFRDICFDYAFDETKSS